LQGKRIRRKDHVVLAVVGISKLPHREKADKESDDSKQSWSTTYTGYLVLTNCFTVVLLILAFPVDFFLQRNLITIGADYLMVQYLILFAEKNRGPTAKAPPSAYPPSRPPPPPPAGKFVTNRVASLPIFTVIVKGLCHKMNIF
jgi:hypothetical protein